MPWRGLLVLLTAGLAGSSAAAAAGAPFVAVALPTAIAVAAPAVAVTFEVVRRRWSSLHAQERVLALSCVLFSAHNIDFAFLRNRESLALAGFTVAFLVLFAISISAPAAVLESVTRSGSIGTLTGQGALIGTRGTGRPHSRIRSFW